MKASERDNIIDDLLKKYPRGPAGVSLTYSHSESWCRERKRYINMYIPSVLYCGYRDEALFSLNIHTKSQAISYIQNRFFPGKSNWDLGRKRSTITRRANRLWQRLDDAVKEVQERGSKGIYKIGRKYRQSGQPLGYVFACSVDEAITVMRTFFPNLDPESHTAHFIEMGNIEKLHEYNKTVQALFERKKHDLEQEIKRAESGIAQLKAHSEMVDVLVGHQIACES